MPIANAKNVSGNTLTSKRVHVSLVVLQQALLYVLGISCLCKFGQFRCDFVQEVIDDATLSEGSSPE